METVFFLSLAFLSLFIAWGIYPLAIENWRLENYTMAWTGWLIVLLNIGAGLRGFYLALTS